MSAVGADLASNELAFIAAQLRRTPGPAAVFGALQGDRAEQVQQLRGIYRRLALAVHPDRHGNDPLAGEAFVMLQRLFETALEQVRRGRYGQASGPAGSNGAAGPVVITTRRRSYTLGDALAEGDLASLYTCS